MSKMEGEPSTLCVAIDGMKAVRDAVEKFIADDGIKVITDQVPMIIGQMCIEFVSLLMIAVGDGTLSGFDSKRTVALLTVLYTMSFIDLDFVPVLGNVDDLFLMYYAFAYCCDKSTTKTANIVLQKNETLFKMIAVGWLLY